MAKTLVKVTPEGAGAGCTTPSKVRKEKSMAEIRRLVAEGYSHNEERPQRHRPVMAF